MDKFLLTGEFNKDDFLPIKKYFSSDFAFYQFLDIIKEEKAIKISKIKKMRSDEQNSYYWGGVIPFIHQLRPFAFLANRELNSKIKTRTTDKEFTVSELYHEMLKHEFNGIQVPSRNDGKMRHIGVSTTLLNTKQFDDYITRIDGWVRENFGMAIPSPDEYKKWVMLESEVGDDNLTFITKYIKENKYPQPEDIGINLDEQYF